LRRRRRVDSAAELLDVAGGLEGTQIPATLAARVRAAQPPVRVHREVRPRLLQAPPTDYSKLIVPLLLSGGAATFASPRAFSDGFAPAMGASAALALAGPQPASPCQAEGGPRPLASPRPALESGRGS
jgi:hypothetical protein